MNLAVAWLSAAEKAVRKATIRAFMLDVRTDSRHHAAYERLLSRFGSSNRRECESAERWYRARLGYVIEAEANGILAGPSRRGWRCVDDIPGDRAGAGDFLLQTPLPHGKLFPCDFSGPRGASSRPDVRVALGDGTEALFDITSRAQEGHVLAKGGGHWLGMRGCGVHRRGPLR